MSDLLSSLTALFSFIFTQLGNFANFFVVNTLGQVILGVVVFGVITSLVVYILRNLR